MNIRIIPVLLLAAILGALVVTLAKFWWWLALFIVIATFAVSTIFVKRFRKIKVLSVLFVICYLITSLGAFGKIFSFERKELPAVSYIDGRVCDLTPTDFEGKLTEKFVILDSLEENGERVKGKIKIFINQDIASQLSVGDRLRASCVASKLELDYSSTKNYEKSIYWEGYLPEYVEGERPYEIKQGKPNFSESIRLFQKKNLYMSTYEGAAGFLYAMTFGDSSLMQDSTKAAFSLTGTAHLFAVSGLHIGILAGSLLWLLKKCKAGKLTQLCITMSVLVVYCVLANFSASVMRATLMVFVMLIASVCGLRNDILSSISLAALILLIINPLSIFSLSFIMSFGAVFGLIFVGKPLNRIMKGVFPSWLAKGLSSSIGANVGLFPILLIYFNKMSLIFIIANLIVIPLISVLFPIYLIASVIGAIPYLNFLITAVGVFFEGITLFVALVAKIKFLTINIEIGWWIVLPQICFMFFVSDYCFVRQKTKRVVASVSAVVFASSCVFMSRGLIFKEDTIYTSSDSRGNEFVMIQTNEDKCFLALTAQLGFDEFFEIKKLCDKNSITQIDGLIVLDKQNKIDDVERLHLAIPIKRVFASTPQPNLLALIPEQHQSWSNDDCAIIFVLGSAEVIVGGKKLIIYPKGKVAKNEIYCDILFGNNQNELSVVKNYVVFDKFLVNNKKCLSWGCVFAIKNGKITVTQSK